jgi:hypothetical protein
MQCHAQPYEGRILYRQGVSEGLKGADRYEARTCGTIYLNSVD